MIPTSREIFTLILHDALIFEGTLGYSLINQNQIQTHGDTFSDVPRKFDEKSTYSLVGIRDKTGESINLPLSLTGIISYLAAAFPSEEQLDTCRQITLFRRHMGSLFPIV